MLFLWFSNPSLDMTAEFCLEIDSTTCFHWSTSITCLSIRWEYISDPSLLPPVIAHSLTVLLHPSSTQSFLALRFSTVWLPCPDCWLTFPIFLSLFPYLHWQVSVRQLAWICPSLHSWCSIRFSPISQAPPDLISLSNWLFQLKWLFHEFVIYPLGAQLPVQILVVSSYFISSDWIFCCCQFVVEEKWPPSFFFCQHFLRWAVDALSFSTPRLTILSVNSLAK